MLIFVFHINAIGKDSFNTLRYKTIVLLAYLRADSIKRSNANVSKMLVKQVCKYFSIVLQVTQVYISKTRQSNFAALYSSYKFNIDYRYRSNGSF